jgi:hypothetical protein
VQFKDIFRKKGDNLDESFLNVLKIQINRRVSGVSLNGFAVRVTA